MLKEFVRASKWVLSATFVAILFTSSSVAEQATEWSDLPTSVRTILENTKPLAAPCGERMPLYLWAAHGAIVDDDDLQERIIRVLNDRGVAVISSWNADSREESLKKSLRVARIQQRLGLPVSVNATNCMYSFFNGDPSTAHLDDQSEPFFDDSISGGKIGCPFRLSHRVDPMRDRVAPFVEAYHTEGLPLDFVFGDWEIDGPLDVNRAWEASRRCKVCREHVDEIEDYSTFQRAVRIKRSELTRKCYSEPILQKFPKALVSNYGVYANDGYRYWYDYFERFELNVPHRLDQRAPYRTWFQVYPLTGYTMAMPVVYPWVRTYHWYDYESTDFRWFYNMLLVASNAGKSSEPDTPIVPFVHWHTVFDPGKPDDSVQAMSRQAYQELLWHMLLRGADTFFLWCTSDQSAIEIELLHEVWADSLKYKDFLTHGKPITFRVSKDEREPVISGLVWRDQVLVRRTDFSESTQDAVQIEIDKQTLLIPRNQKACQVLKLKS